jgi:hypothetical protein
LFHSDLLIVGFIYSSMSDNPYSVRRWLRSIDRVLSDNNKRTTLGIYSFRLRFPSSNKSKSIHKKLDLRHMDVEASFQP